MNRTCLVLAGVAAGLGLQRAAQAAVLFSEAGESLANYSIVTDSADVTSGVVDYSTLSIPESPRQISGSAATTGIKLTANKGDATGAITGLDLILANAGTPVSFSGTHTLSFDFWFNAPSDATSTTEGILGGTARTVTNTAIIRNFRTSRGNGGWFYIAGDNGNATDDFGYLNNGTRNIAAADTDGATYTAKYNAAFQTAGSSTTTDAPENQWVKVDIVQDGATNSVYFNGVLFGTETTTNTSGAAWIGYEDFFASIGSSTVYGIFDNIMVVEGNAVPEPTCLAAMALGGLMLRRRR